MSANPFPVRFTPFSVAAVAVGTFIGGFAATVGACMIADLVARRVTGRHRQA